MLDYFMNSIFFQTFGSSFLKGFKKFQNLGIGAYFLTLLPFLLIGVIYQSSYNGASFIGKILLTIAFLLAFFLISFDVTAVECFFEKYDESEYYLATGVTRKELVKDKGLLGEFNAYVLSKKLDTPHKVLFNVCIPMPNGNYQEVDAIIITNSYLYAIECKNRAGVFQADFNEDVWIQRIGKQEHQVKNIYVQNQNHIIAMEHFLKSKGIIEEYDYYTWSLVLTGGEMYLDTQANLAPEDFAFGDVDYLKKCIVYQETKNKVDRGTDFMESVYRTLLPYALNDNKKRAQMQNTRDVMSKNGEFQRGKYRYYRFPNGIVGMTKADTVLRKDNIYSQIAIDAEIAVPTWMTVTNVDYIER